MEKELLETSSDILVLIRQLKLKTNDYYRFQSFLEPCRRNRTKDILNTYSLVNSIDANFAAQIDELQEKLSGEIDE